MTQKEIRMVPLNKFAAAILNNSPDKMVVINKQLYQNYFEYKLSEFKLSTLWLCSPLSWNRFMHCISGNIKHGYRIAAWNCRRGLLLHDNTESTKLDDIKVFLHRYDIHLFGLIECDLHGIGSRIHRANPISTNEILDSLKIDGYSIKLPKSWFTYNQARIILYVKEGIKVKWKELDAQDSDLPSLSCEIGSGKEARTSVNFFYREWKSGVTGLDDTSSQVNRLNRQIAHWKKLYNGGNDVVILGDANICYFKWNEASYAHKQVSDLIHDFLLEQSSFQQIKCFTRSEISSNGISRSCIDHCYTDVPEKLSQVKVESIGDSDHLGIVVTKLSRYIMPKPQTIRKRCYKNFDVESFLYEIYFSDINESVVREYDLEIAARIFETKFTSILDRYAPMKTLFVRRNYRPEICLETKQLIAEKQVLHKEACRTGNRVLLAEYKSKCKEVKKSIKKDKKLFDEKQMIGGSVQNAWKQSKRILKLENNLAPTSVLRNGEVISNPGALANIFNDYFIEKVKLLRAKTSTVATSGAIERVRNWLTTRPPSFKFREIDRDTFRKLMKKIKSKRAFGVDQIDSSSLKLAAPLIEDALIHLINLSICTGQFANVWKPQLIVPLHKKGDRMSTENYRPVSHLVELGKLVERAIFDQVVAHFMENELFHQNLHGSRKDHSTTTALIQVMDQLYKASEQEQLSAVLLLDQSAAYDLLDHGIFLEKLKAYNFDNISVSWFDSYLSGCTQIVQVESKLSNVQSVNNHAAPQGSILAGLIFIIYSNDFPACSIHGESIVYVDDNTDIVTEADPNALKLKIQMKADDSVAWLKDNRMCVAGSKSKLLVVGTKLQKKKDFEEIGHLNVKIDGQTIFESKSEKLLGVVISDNLTWKEHLHGETWREQNNRTSGLISQLSRRVGMVKRLSKYMSRQRLKIFADGLFYSKLDYCLPVFGHVFGLDRYNVDGQKFLSYTKEDNRKLQVLQNSIMRLLTGLPRETPTSFLLGQTNTLSIQQRIAFQTLILTKKIVSAKKPTYIAEKLIFQNDAKSMLRGQYGNLNPQNCRLNSSRAGFLYQSAKLFNNLPMEIKLEGNANRFKFGVRNWICANVPIKP